MTFHAVVKSSSLTKTLSQTLNVWYICLQTGYLLLTVNVGKYSIPLECLGMDLFQDPFESFNLTEEQTPLLRRPGHNKNLAPASRVFTAMKIKTCIYSPYHPCILVYIPTFS